MATAAGTVKVLQLGKGMTPPSTGGIEKVIGDIALNVGSDLVRCDVLCVSATRQQVLESSRSGTIVRVPRWGKLFSQVIAPRLFWELWKRRKDYDIVHVHCPDPLASLALLIVRPQAHLVVHWHSDIVRQRLLRRVYLPLQRWMLRRARRIVATSARYARSSVDLREFSAKVSVIPIGIDPSDLVVDAPFLEQLKHEYRGKRIVFTLGRLAYYKDFRTLVRAAAALPPDCVVLIGGDGELRHELQSIIDKSSLGTRVRLLGLVNETALGAYYEACDLFVLPSNSRAEAFGIVQLHAMSFGKPVVSTEIPGSGVSWVNEHGNSGLVVPPADPEALAAAMSALLSDEPLRSRLGKGARARFLEHFTLERMTNALERLYVEVAGDPTR
jgi:glycosyltransferase involved in cell wall biosynthesis